MSDIDHTFMSCGAGSKTSDQACYLVRLGGDRGLCHYTEVVTDSLERFCQRPETEHEEVTPIQTDP